MSSADILAILARMFPSFRGLPAEEATRRGEALGRFAAGLWAGGGGGLRAAGVPVPAPAFAQLAPLADGARAGGSGLSFLASARAAFADDVRYARFLTALAAAFAARSGAGAPPSPAAPEAASPVSPPAAAPRPADPGPAPLELLSERPGPEGAPDPAPALDLLPAEPEHGTDPAPEELLAADPRFAPPVAGGGLDLVPEERAAEGDDPRAGSVAFLATTYEEALEEGDPDAGDSLPEDPTERAVVSYERTGDPSFLDDAQRRLEAERAAAPHAIAASVAEAGLARIALLRGDAEAAERLARGAQGRFPGNPLAAEVLARVARGEAADATFLRSLRELARALDSRDVGWIEESASRLAGARPTEPHGHLGLLFLAQLRGDGGAFERHLKDAWTCYPSPDHPQFAFGGRVDADIVDALLRYGRRPIERLDEELLRHTVEGIDEKTNLIAGSLRMAVGLARVALLQPGLPRAVQRRLHFAAGRGLMGLQYFEAAPEAMGRALMLAPTPDEHKVISKERLQCQALWRAFDKPGIKAQQRKYPCLGVRGASEWLRARLATLAREREARQRELFDKAPLLVERAASDPALASEVAAAAEEQAVPDPLAAVRAVDAELAALARGAEAAAAAQPKGKGLFGRLKEAANTAASAARGAANKLKESQLRTRREDALRRLARALAGDLREHPYRHPLLAAYARQAVVLEAFLDHIAAEERKAQRLLARLAELS
ncbi:MAG: hypothetical protein D6731_17240 [Planctomycetota bacterium]|nr:MAG: hypothetical protein D6731_17240 [Planctomycetota bacterium]